MRRPRSKLRLPRALALVASLFAFAYAATAVPAFADSWTAVVATGAPTAQLTPINLANDAPGTPSAVVAAPGGVAVTPDGLYAFVAGSGGVTRVAIPGGQTTAIAIPQTHAGTPDTLTFIAISPGGDLAYVSDTTNGAVWQITGLEGAVPVVSASPIYLGSPTAQPEGIAFTPDGSTAYVADSEAFAPAVVPIITGDGVPEPPESWLGGGSDPGDVGTPWALAISPDGSTLYVTDIAGNQVYPVALAGLDVGSPIAVGTDPTAIALTPDGNTAFVADSGAHTVTLISDLGGTPTPSPLPLGGAPFDLAVAPDGCTLYVSGAGGVTPVTGVGAPPCAATGTTVGAPITLPGASGFAGIAITPDQPPTASFTFTLGSPGAPVIFDPSTSSTPDGTIADYTWQFGDNSPQLSESGPAAVMHTYAPGPYQATLTVTNSTGTSTNQVFTGRAMLRNGGDPAAETQTVMAPAIIQPSPATIRFATQLIGTASAPQTVTFTNMGLSTYHVTRAAAGGAFPVTSDSCTGADLAPGATCSVAVAFAPQAAGTQLTTLTLNDSAPGGQQGVVLSGTGMAPATSTTTSTSAATSGQQTSSTTTSSTQTSDSVTILPEPVGHLRVTLSVRSQSRRAIARAHAIAVTCGLSSAGTCTVKATIAAKVAHTLGLGPARASKPFTVGSAKAKLARGGTAKKLAIAVSSKVATALTRSGGPVKITLVASGSDSALQTGSAGKSLLAG